MRISDLSELNQLKLTRVLLDREEAKLDSDEALSRGDLPKATEHASRALLLGDEALRIMKGGNAD